jgi:hypothetical protein
MQQDGSKRPWEERVAEAGARLRDEFGDELKRVVKFIDTEVVPEVRRNGSTALRAAAERLHQLAEHMDKKTGAEAETKSSDETEPR